MLGRLAFARRLLTSSASADGTSERRLELLLRQRFPPPARVEVNDVSGGTGSQWHVLVESCEFGGLKKSKRSRRVLEVLRPECPTNPNMLGFRIDARVPGMKRK